MNDQSAVTVILHRWNGIIRCRACVCLCRICLSRAHIYIYISTRYSEKQPARRRLYMQLALLNFHTDPRLDDNNNERRLCFSDTKRRRYMTFRPRFLGDRYIHIYRKVYIHVVYTRARRICVTSLLYITYTCIERTTFAFAIDHILYTRKERSWNFEVKKKIARSEMIVFGGLFICFYGHVKAYTARFGQFIYLHVLSNRFNAYSCQLASRRFKKFDKFSIHDREEGWIQCRL